MLWIHRGKLAPWVHALAPPSQLQASLSSLPSCPCPAHHSAGSMVVVSKGAPHTPSPLAQPPQLRQ